MTTNHEPRMWNVFAGQRTGRDGTSEYAAFYPHPDLVEMSGYPTVHEVVLVEDIDGDLLGWIDADRPDQIVMVQHKQIFSIQFPYGIQPEIDRDDGEAVPLRAEPRA